MWVWTRKKDRSTGFDIWRIDCHSSTRAVSLMMMPCTTTRWRCRRPYQWFLPPAFPWLIKQGSQVHTPLCRTITHFFTYLLTSLYICQLIYNPEYYAKVNCNSHKEEGGGVKWERCCSEVVMVMKEEKGVRKHRTAQDIARKVSTSDIKLHNSDFWVRSSKFQPKILEGTVQVKY